MRNANGFFRPRQGLRASPAIIQIRLSRTSERKWREKMNRERSKRAPNLIWGASRFSDSRPYSDMCVRNSFRIIWDFAQIAFGMCSKTKWFNENIFGDPFSNVSYFIFGFVCEWCCQFVRDYNLATETVTMLTCVVNNILQSYPRGTFWSVWSSFVD